jgi:hypothetical protein
MEWIVFAGGGFTQFSSGNNSLSSGIIEASKASALQPRDIPIPIWNSLYSSNR